MKVTPFFATALVASLFALPLEAAGPKLDQAVALAAEDSEAKLDAICLAVYEAALEAPDEVDKVFEAVLSQRTTWKAGEVYAIMRAILMARPDLAGNLNSNVAANKGGKNQKGAYNEPAPDMDPMLYKLLNVLYQASLEDGVAENAINTLTTTITGVYENSVNEAHNSPDVNTNLIEGFIPTPPPVSSQN